MAFLRDEGHAEIDINRRYGGEEATSGDEAE
jgi:hypothetical protein